MRAPTTLLVALLAALLAALAACSFSGGGNPGDGDGDASVDSTAADCSCVAGEQVCMGEQPLACPVGCNDGDGRCNPIAPSNGADDHSIDTAAVDAWEVANNVLVDTDSGAITGATSRPGGAGVMAGIGYEQVDGNAVFVVASMHVEAGATVQVIGSLPIIIRAAGDVLIEGKIDVSAGLDASCGLLEQRSCGGPGGGGGGDTNQAATGCGPGEDGDEGGGGDGEAGGGGGGGGADGADGGDAGGSSNGGNGGNQCIAVDVVPLVGGSGGGRGGDEAGDSHAGGGGGGGAIQISSDREIRVVGNGAIAGIEASGEGGAGGGTEDGGGGGGAGGAILLEAPAVHLEEATLAANGGAGGGRQGGNDGEAGRFDDNTANGTDGGGDGGTDTPPQQGSNTNTDSGGGGAGAGRVRINTNDLTTAGAVIRSPTGTAGSVTAAGG